MAKLQGFAEKLGFRPCEQGASAEPGGLGVASWREKTCGERETKFPQRDRTGVGGWRVAGVANECQAMVVCAVWAFFGVFLENLVWLKRAPAH